MISAKKFADDLKSLNNDLMLFEKCFARLRSELLSQIRTLSKKGKLKTELEPKDNRPRKTESETVIDNLEESLIRAKEVIKLTGNKITKII